MNADAVRNCGAAESADAFCDRHPKLMEKIRLTASNEEILSLNHSAGEQEIKAAHKKAALTYHPDKFGSYDDLLKQIANRRMQEANDAKEALLKKKANG